MNTPKITHWLIVCCAAAWITGCSSDRSEGVYSGLPEGAESGAVQSAEESTPEVIVTPDTSVEGAVVSVNNAGRFAVLRFPAGQVPSTGSTLFVYREGVKVAELSVSGPQKDDHTVADIRSGECRANDAVRNR